MTETPPHDARWRVRTFCRVGWTIASIFVVEAAVCGLATVPVLLLWMWLVEWTTSASVLRTIVFSVSIVPSYILFALCLMTLSPIATRITGARTPRNAEMRLSEMGWPLMTWARYVAATHVVRQLAGPLFRGSPIWTAYLRLNGARIGRRVYVNTLFISDHNLLEFGDDVVIGSEVHISGHVVEGDTGFLFHVDLGLALADREQALRPAHAFREEAPEGEEEQHGDDPRQHGREEAALDLARETYLRRLEIGDQPRIVHFHRRKVVFLPCHRADRGEAFR